MKNYLNRTRRAAAPVLSTAASTVATVLVTAYVLVGVVAAGADGRLRRRVPDVRDRGALSLEQAILTAVLSAAAIALGAFILNAILNHQNQIR